MSYWHETIHDDVFLVMNDGWLGAAKPRKTIEDKERKLSETPDLVIGSGRSVAKYKMDLIPPALIVARYFAKEQARQDLLVAAAEDATRAVNDFVEEHAVEDGLLAEAMDDDKISRALVSARLRVAMTDGVDLSEITILKQTIKLYDAEASARKAAKEGLAELDNLIINKYGELTDIDVKDLVLDDKWQATIRLRITARVETLTRALVIRIKQLGSRYGETVGALDKAVKSSEESVAAHLKVLGFLE